MSYDLFTFRLPAGAEPGDYATEVVEAFDDDAVPDPSWPTVERFVNAVRAEFPGVEVPEQDEDSAVLLLEDRLVSIDVMRSHTEICVSYGVEKDAAWLTGLLAGIARAAAAAGHDTLFDAQIDQVVDPSDPADAAAIAEHYGEGLAMVAELRAEQSGGGFLRRLFRR